MLINYRVRNFKSLGEPIEFTTVPGKYKKNYNHIYETGNYRSLRLSTIFGANASGKSNFVSSVKYLRATLQNGKVFRNSNNLKFRLSDLGSTIDFEIEILVDSEIFLYGISINPELLIVEQEYLYKIGTTTNKLLFNISRTKDELSNIEYSSSIKNKEKNRLDIYVHDLEPNELFIKKLSEAKLESNTDVFSSSKAFYSWFINTLVVVTPYSSPREIFSQFGENSDDEDIMSVIEILKLFDTGITDINYNEMNVNDFLDIIRNNVGLDDKSFIELQNEILEIKKNQRIETSMDGSYYRIEFDTELNKPVINSISFEHCNVNTKTFGFDEESDGTKRLIELVNILYNIQYQNKVYIIDELERSFHSNITVEFVKMFLKLSRGKSSQLIVTTHETNLMDLDVLRPDELWITERKKCGTTDLIPLSKYNFRSDKVIDKDYLHGRYGGVPKIMKMILPGDDLNE